MKHVIHKIVRFSVFTLLSAFPLLQSCSSDEEAMKWVDLRYRVNDSYSVEAQNPLPISFQVKSTDPWEVYGKYDWYVISPDKGEAGETYTVTITCKENTGLDDRIDTISIKSDYWTGKRVVVVQKGTAYLNAGEVGIIPQSGGQTAFDVLSNQKWTAEVTEGATWMSIQAGTSGELDGRITVQASGNSGEQRTGIVTIYDRHGKVAQEVQCIQAGAVLAPETPANGKWYAIYEEAQKLTIHVESNTEWEVSKENPEDDDWYTFEKTSFNGSDNLVINVIEHKGFSVRTGVIILTTKAGEGASPVTKTIRFKQANPPVAQVTELNRTVSGADFSGPGGLAPGQYNFYIEPLGNTQFRFFFSWKGTPTLEHRFHILLGKTSLSTTPWCNNVNSGVASTIRSVDTSKPHVLSFNFTEVVDKDDPTKSWLCSEWILDGEVIAKAIADGKDDVTGATDTWVGAFERTEAGGNYLFRATDGSAVVTKYEYIGPPDWGE